MLHHLSGQLAIVLQKAADTAGQDGGSFSAFTPEKLHEYLVDAQDWLVLNSPKLLAAILIYLVGRWLTRLLVRLLRKGMNARKVDETLTRFLCNMLAAALTILVVLTAVGKLGIQTASFVAMLGAATLAVGFALQGSLSNFAAGILIIVFRPFRVGEYVEAGGSAGSVEEVSLFATTLRTFDGKRVVVPNSSITGGNIINYSINPTRRVDLVFGIGYGDDLKKAKEILQRLLSEEPRVLADPPPTVAVLELGDSSVNLACRPWVSTADYWAVHFDLTERVKLAFDAAGVQIPFPQRDVHLHQVAS